MARLAVERLEERLALSGFGPEDGAYIVEEYPNSSYQAVKIQSSDQKIVAAGSNYIPGEGARFAIARYDSLGEADATFGSGGLSTPALGSSFEVGNSLVLQSDNKAVVAGMIRISGNAQSDLGVARFNANGSLDTGFSGDGWTNLGIQSRSDEAAYGVGLQSTGKLVVAGNSDPFTGGGGPSDNRSLVARFTTIGALDSGRGGFGQLSGKNPAGYTVTTFGAPSSALSDLAVQPDDKIVAAGTLNDGSNERLVVARYTASGNLDTSFNGTGYKVFLPAGFSYAVANEVSLQSDGKIVIAGYSSGIDGDPDVLVVRLNTDGTLDTGFGAGSGYARFDIDGLTSVTSEVARGIVVQPDGKIVVAGGVREGGAGGRAGVLAVRFNQNGTPDSTFGVTGYKSSFSAIPAQSLRGYSLALQSDGTIIVAGTSSGPEVAGSSRPFLARFFGDQAPSSPLTAGRTDATSAYNFALLDTTFGSGSVPATVQAAAPLTTDAGRFTATGTPNQPNRTSNLTFVPQGAVIMRSSVEKLTSRTPAVRTPSGKSIADQEFFAASVDSLFSDDAKLLEALE